MTEVLVYALEQGPTEKTIIEQCVRQGLPLPDTLRDAPELELGLELYYLAFCDLTSCREQGYSEGPISWLTINAYARAKRYKGEQCEDLFYFVQVMDRTYLEFKAKKAKSQTNTGIGKAKPKARKK